MANEFKVKNGFILDGKIPSFTGSLTDNIGMNISFGTDASSTGTIVNQYVLYMTSDKGAGTTITNSWGIYQIGNNASNSKNHLYITEFGDSPSALDITPVITSSISNITTYAKSSGSVKYPSGGSKVYIQNSANITTSHASIILSADNVSAIPCHSYISCISTISEANTTLVFGTQNNPNSYQETFRMSGGKLSTLGEDTPDVSAGGLCLNQGAADTNILTFKSSDVAHSFTSQEENDTWGAISKLDPNGGGWRLKGYSDSPVVSGFTAEGYVGATAPTVAPLKLIGNKSDGANGVSTLSDTERILSIFNFTNEKITVNGSGALLINHPTPQSYNATFGLFQVVNDDPNKRISGLYQFSNDIYSHVLAFGKSRSGTKGTMTYPTLDDLLGQISFGGADEADSRFETGASVIVKAEETWTATGHGSYISINTVPTTSLTVTERMRITASGTIYFYQSYNDTVGATNRDLYIDDTGKIGYVSSIKASKMNINYNPNIEWIYKLQTVEFNYRKKTEDKYTDIPDGDIQYGLIAEEVATIKPEICYVNANGDLEGVNYSRLIPVLLKAIQDLKQEMRSLKNEKFRTN